MRVKRRLFADSQTRVKAVVFPDGGYISYRKGDRNWRKKLTALLSRCM